MQLLSCNAVLSLLMCLGVFISVSYSCFKQTIRSSSLPDEFCLPSEGHCLSISLARSLLVRDDSSPSQFAIVSFTSGKGGLFNTCIVYGIVISYVADEKMVNKLLRITPPSCEGGSKPEIDCVHGDYISLLTLLFVISFFWKVTRSM